MTLPVTLRALTATPFFWGWRPCGAPAAATLTGVEMARRTVTREDVLEAFTSTLWLPDTGIIDITLGTVAGPDDRNPHLDPARGGTFVG